MCLLFPDESLPASIGAVLVVSRNLVNGAWLYSLVWKASGKLRFFLPLFPSWLCKSMVLPRTDLYTVNEHKGKNEDKQTNNNHKIFLLLAMKSEASTAVLRNCVYPPTVLSCSFCVVVNKGLSVGLLLLQVPSSGVQKGMDVQTCVSGVGRALTKSEFHRSI